MTTYSAPIYLLLTANEIFAYSFSHSAFFNKAKSAIRQFYFDLQDKFSPNIQINISDRTLVMSVQRIACFIVKMSFLKTGN